MVCLHCGKKIGVLRKLKDEEFCTAAHRKAYKKKQEDLAVDFLLQSKPRARPKPRAAEPPAAPATPAETQPILLLAEFVDGRITPGRMDAALLRNVEPVPGVTPLSLPRHAGVTAGGMRASGFSPVDVRPSAAVNCVESRVLCSLEFGSELPCLETAVARPLWIEPATQVPSERRRAPFIAWRPAWVQTGREFARSSAVARFSFAMDLIPADDLAPAGPAFRLAGPSRTSFAAARTPAALRSSQRGVWLAPLEVTNMPSGGMAAWTPGFLPCDPVSAAVSRAYPAPASGTTVPAPDPRTSQEPPLTPSWNIDVAAPSLQTAPLAVAEAPRPLSAASHKDNRPGTLVWQFRIQMGPYARVNVIRPPFEAPIRELPVRSFQRKLPARPVKRLADLWFAAPRYARRIAVVAALGLVALVVASRIDLTGRARGARDAVISRISRRAAVDIQDDFRSGLSRWTGAPGWANSWSYDGTGFARPGRLALLSGSLPLADYRLEFLGQIEKKAIAWVFRAADARNYYATKLVETNHGPEAAFFIVRYAVVGGRERLRIQLPLPVTGPVKTMFRVRQEIRGAQFTTYLDGRVVDTWSDSSLARGGVGFFADPGEAAYIRWVDVAYQDDPLGRLCSYLAPGKRN